jgi:arylsulfatase A-like enzyme
MRMFRPRFTRFCNSLAASCLVILGSMAPGRGFAGDEPLPNMVLVLADDLGYGDVQAYNRERGRIPTLHIDRLAAEGMSFSDAHSSSAVCSPTRYTLLTGRYHWRTRLQRGIVGVFEEPLIAPDRLTIAGLLRQKNYRTACIGKWHLGWNWNIPDGQRALFRIGKEDSEVVTPEHLKTWEEVFSRAIADGPTTRGFDTYFGTDVPNWPPYCFIENDRTVGIPTEFLPARLLGNNQASVPGPALADWTLEPILPALVDRACRTISAWSSQDRPFFLYLPLTSPHTPLAVNTRWRGQSGLNLYADLVMETDAAVGQILAAIDQSGARERTLVIFTSDNGCAPYIGVSDLEARGHFPSGPLRGYKSDVWEGGHRVPFIVRWPGRVAAGSTQTRLVAQADIMATCADIVGVPLPADAAVDSISLLPLLLDPDQPDWSRSPVVHHSAQGMFAVRRDRWKLVLGQGSGGWGKDKTGEAPGQLYDLSTDLAEAHNVYASHPEKVAELWRDLLELVDRGRSTPGAPQTNDVPVQVPRPAEAARSGE